MTNRKVPKLCRFRQVRIIRVCLSVVATKKQKLKKPKMTIFEAYNKTKKALNDANIEDSVFEAKEIIKHITGFNSTQILTEYTKELTPFQENNLTAIIHQRQIRYPLQYIFGNWDFYGRNFCVGVGVLTPRADTETLIDVCLKKLKDKKEPKILDLCAGSGCIGITLALEKQDSKVLMLEKYQEAYRYAEKNITRLKSENATLYKGDVLLGDLSDTKYDLIVSNPPYISKDEMNEMSVETKFEPETALLANDDGLEFYKAISKTYKNSLKDGGALCFEVGYKQATKVKQILEDDGYTLVEFTKDLNGINRVVSATK